MIVEKDISQLAVGAFIVDIVEQTGKIKIRNPGWVREFSAIEKLIKEGVKRVKVDTSKHLQAEQEDDSVGAATDKDTEQGSVSKINEQSFNSAQAASAVNEYEKKIKAYFGERLIEAKQVFDEAKAIQAGVLDEIAKNRPIDIQGVSRFADKSMDIIFQNPDALTCVLGIRVKDQYLLEHSVSVSVLMSVFAMHLGFEKGLIKQLAIGAFLHDVGKIKIDESVLNKPGKLTAEEFEEIKMHAVHSKDIVDNTSGLSEISKQIVANHHEKLNGGGYPRGLKDPDLTQYDRMIAICDIFDALSADRVYKEGMPLLKAFSILRELAATQHLDAILVDQFIHCMGVYPVGSLVQLRSKRLAIVERRNEDSPTKPLVTAFFNLGRNAFTETRKIDLSKNPNESIEKAVRATDFGLNMEKVSEFLMMQG